MKLYICDFTEYLTIKEQDLRLNFINNVQNLIIQNKEEVDYIITCLSNLVIYHENFNKGYIDIKNFIIDNFNLDTNTKIITFNPISTFYLKNVINVCYSKLDIDEISILICPHTINNYNFNKSINKKYHVSFKGNINITNNRKKLYYILKKI